jgi:heme a synthase
MRSPTSTESVSPGRRKFLFALAVVTTVATLPLIFVGGLVTSHGAALAVPDWPTSFGYNMFFFPWEKMVGGIFYEHTHRLLGSLVGFLTLLLCVFLWLWEDRKWVKWMGLTALIAVCIQGLLGGGRVVMLIKGMAIVHACLAQAFFCYIAILSLCLSGWWRKITSEGGTHSLPNSGLRRGLVLFTTVIFIQLILGALMRHKGAGLAVPDFPLFYGQVLPIWDAASLEMLNDHRIWKLGLEPVTSFQILLHLAHRFWAVTVVLAAILSWRSVRREIPRQQGKPMHFILKALAILLALQVFLGMTVIWSQKAADLATAHVALGALILMLASLLTVMGFKLVAPPEKSETMDVSPQRDRVAPC